MKKIILSLILAFGILFSGNTLAQYEIVSVKVMEDDFNEGNYIPFNPLSHNFVKIKPNTSNYELFKEDLIKYNIKKSDCDIITNFQKNNDGIIVGCNNDNRLSIFNNSVKLNTLTYDFSGQSISSILKKGDKLYVDMVAFRNINVGYRYVFQNFEDKSKLIKKNILIKKELNGTKYSKILRKIDLFVPKMNIDKLKNLKKKLLLIKIKYKNHKNILNLLEYLENLIKLNTGQYSYIINENNFSLDIKNDKNANKVLFGRVFDDNIKFISLEYYGKLKPLKSIDWEINTNMKFSDNKKYFTIYYYNSAGRAYYKQVIKSGKNTNEDNFILNIRNDINNNKVLFGEVLDKNVVYIDLNSFDYETNTYSRGSIKLKGTKWSINTEIPFRNNDYKVTYYDKNGNIYFIQKIFSGANIKKNNFKLGIKNDKDYKKILFGEVLDKNVKSIIVDYSTKVENFSGGKWEQNTNDTSGKHKYDVKYYDKNGKLYYQEKIYID